MKRILLSTLTVAALATAATANTSSELKALKAQMAQMAKKIAELESKQAKSEAVSDVKKKATPVYAKTSKIKFSGQHYLGFVSKKVSGESRTNNFEMRRNYVQVKAYLFDDPKSYMRFTLDETTGNGDNTLRIKYAYLYLDNVLPYTGVEVGQAHRPWLDYEEHQGWWHRAVDKTFTESKESADLTNSADMGVNFKTKTAYFTSEIGLFNGEGYHDHDYGKGLSAEWRLTAALLGNGNQKRHARKSTYFDASFWGQYNAKNSKNDHITYKLYGFHAVYNQPSFLIAAQYNIAKNDNNNPANALKHRMHHNGHGYSVNADYRFGEGYQYDLFARYDRWVAEDPAHIQPDATMEHYLYGVAWEQNKNVTWYLNGKHFTPKEGVNYEGSAKKKFDAVMLTAEVNW
ncbi:MAG: hypothetical protein DSZ10_00995 [Sulfurovum sp.]|nr:MAG: hypothetical protein DSZ10_00995 [Sulfurovum sp.]